MINKYRAKRKKENVWIYGSSFLDIEMGMFLLPPEQTACCMSIGEDITEIDNAVWLAIDPATLSRVTGLTACGQHVFEGDILQFYVDGTASWWTAVMCFGWDEDGGYGWYLKPIRNPGFNPLMRIWLGDNAAPGITAAVIGNVWDNPELMEGVCGNESSCSL